MNSVPHRSARDGCEPKNIREYYNKIRRGIMKAIYPAIHYLAFFMRRMRLAAEGSTRQL